MLVGILPCTASLFGLVGRDPEIVLREAGAAADRRVGVLIVGTSL
jgi:hypothetical protein